MPEVSVQSRVHAVHLNLDNAWSSDTGGLATIDVLQWGPKLRFSAPSREIEAFFAGHDALLAPFILYGSGDFHHLTALWLRRTREPLVVVAFDNHPDWDVRPPRWACGAWVNRALELSQVRKVSVWGCGNFECWWPAQSFGNRRAEREGKLDVHPWADERPIAQQTRRGALFRATWREAFQSFVAELKGGDVYVTIDLDCLQRRDAITNWEEGKFSAGDLVWAIKELRGGARIVAGDLCGAFSTPEYARRKQRFAAEMDHPKLPPWDPLHAYRVNLGTFEKLWPVLAEGDHDHTSGDQEGAGD